jgi:hypothetical protein
MWYCSGKLGVQKLQRLVLEQGCFVAQSFLQEHCYMCRRSIAIAPPLLVTIGTSATGFVQKQP